MKMLNPIGINPEIWRLMPSSFNAPRVGSARPDLALVKLTTVLGY
jgi:hypothetical protein